MSKWLCHKCKAINAYLGASCYNCGCIYNYADGIGQLETGLIGWKHDCQAKDHKIAQLEADLRNKDAVRLWNENEKLTEANRILREGLEFYVEGTEFSMLGFTAQQALKQVDKIMEGDE